MPPKLYLVRHAQGEHNATVSFLTTQSPNPLNVPQRNYNIRDPVLTAKGIAQCHELRDKFPYHDSIDLVIASPLRRTIQTAAHSFGPTLARTEVPFVLVPLLQEVSNAGCDTGYEVDDLKTLIPDLFKGEELGFDITKIGYENVMKGWTEKVRTRYLGSHHVDAKVLDFTNT